ncbi:hypothetical protein [Aquiflexum lacus]|uniref:hypothetical protein n=1 Tax=Aquiflexum lacus TaxID=2483805 RepID=UPI001892F0EF|nr:hypothetical protein [Aquiflexum lacus]
MINCHQFRDTIKEKIIQPKDKKQLEALEAMFNAFGIEFRLKETQDFWDQIPEEIKNIVESSQQQIKNGDYFSLEEVKKHFDSK